MVEYHNEDQVTTLDGSDGKEVKKDLRGQYMLYCEEHDLEFAGKYEDGYYRREPEYEPKD
jgi:hypothetical protein